MTVATVIPCFREQVDRVRRTVESVLATRGMTRAIVVDDGCNDDALDALRSDRVEVIHLAENGGCSVALNAGIRTLEPDDIACRLDVGDVFYAEAKARQLDAVISGTARCSSSGHFDPVTSSVWALPDRWEKAIYRDSVFTGCTNVYRVSVWSEVGGHDESLRYCADWDFSMKVQHVIGWHIHNEPTVDAGMYPDGFSARAQLNSVTKQRRVDDRSEVALRGRILSHPDAYAHLKDPTWRKKHGLP